MSACASSGSGTGRKSAGKGNRMIDMAFDTILDRLDQAQKVMIGLGSEWRLREDGRPIGERSLGRDAAQETLLRAYRALYSLVADKDYYVVTTLTEGAVYDTPFAPDRIVAPCGNIHWRQCPEACTKDIWEEGEAPDDICPHCGAPLTGNTIQAPNYIEEGYMPRWAAYTKWQAGTLNRSLLLLELGVGFDSPTVIRWPFEKIAYVNQKACLVRVHETLFQLPREVGERAVSQAANSTDWVMGLAEAAAARGR